MGKDFLPCKLNGISLKEVFDKVKDFEVKEASQEGLFYFKPKMYEIKDIEIGQDGTHETVIRLKDGNFCVLDGTVRL